MESRAPREIFARRMAGPAGLVDRLLDLVGSIPAPRERPSADPKAQSQRIARTAASRAASAAGALALPPGPIGWLTIAPELYAVWRIQAQMVADIAGAYDKPELLNREQMLYCLFSHTAASSFSDLVIRAGERYVIRRAPLSALYAVANKAAIRIAHRSAARVASRWIPALGALGVAGYVYLDTGRVAAASMDLFAADVLIEGEAQTQSADPGVAEPASKVLRKPARRKSRKPPPDGAA